MARSFNKTPGLEPGVALGGIRGQLMAGYSHFDPFTRWHFRRKFEVTEDIFRRYLTPGARFADMACGSGDALLLASACQPDCELWGLDIDAVSLDIAKERTNAKVFQGDILNPCLPKDYFNVVHEFGATFFVRRWDLLAKSYLSLLRKGGILLWELPEKWSTAHVSYLLSLAPKITEADTPIRRIARSFLPSKYHYETDAGVLEALNATGFKYEIVDKVPIWHFFCNGLPARIINLLWKFYGDGVYDSTDRLTARLWPRLSGYYLVVRKL